MKELIDIVLERIADGHAYGKMSATPPTWNEQLELAQAELDRMPHTEFLRLISSAIDDMFPEEK